MIKIMKAKPEDASVLTSISTETFDDDSRRYFGRDQGGPPGYNDQKTHLYNINENTYYKICLKDKIIGGLFLTKKDEYHIELSNIYISPTYQNKGYGQLIIKQVEEKYPEIKKWTLDTPSVCVRNHHLYEKCGYQKVNEIMLDKASNLKLYFYEKEMK